VPRSAAAVRRALQGRFEQPARGQPTNDDAVTLARLDAEGVTPAPIVALLGMSSGAFPRAPQRPDWDPRRRPAAPELDPNLRDRYALRCAVAWAREGLWISFVGRATRQGQELPPCVPVAELFAALSPAAGGKVFTEGARHPWQPDALPRWDADLGQLPTQDTGPGDGGAPALAEPRRRWTIDELVGRLLHPAKALLLERLGLYLSDEEEPLSEREPIDFNGLDSWKVRDGLLKRTWICPSDAPQGRPPLLQSADAAKKQATAALSDTRRALIGAGELPPGGAGEVALAAALADVHATIDSYHKLDVVEAEAHVTLQHRLQINDRTVELVGQVEAVVHGKGGTPLHHWLTTSSADKPKAKLRAWLHLLLAWASGAPVAVARTVGKGGEAEYLWPDELAVPTAEGARATLCALVQLAEDCGRLPLPLFERTSAAFAERWCRAAGRDAETEGQGERLAAAVETANAEWFGSSFSPYPPERLDRWIAALHPTWTPQDAVRDVKLDQLSEIDPHSFMGLALTVWTALAFATKTDKAGTDLYNAIGVTK
jgi:exodeoxyribonuclease V gamma subunit